MAQSMDYTKGKRLKKTTLKQYEEMLHFVQENKILVSGKTKPLEANKINQLWQEFAKKVNCTGYGPEKTAKQWHKIFNEWKVNTRRKSREVKLSIKCTGAGKGTKKKLSDLEEQLLSLLSKIHLGDESLPDSMEVATELSSTETVEIYHINSEEDAVYQATDSTQEEIIKIFEEKSRPVLEVIYEDLSDHTHLSSFTAQDPSTPTKKNLPKEYATLEDGKKKNVLKKKTIDQRYTNSILQSACQSYTDAQKIKTDNDSKKAEAINNLAKAITGFTEVYQEKVKAEKMRAQAEMIKSKIEYFKTFGNLDGFSD